MFSRLSFYEEVLAVLSLTGQRHVVTEAICQS